MLLSDWLGAVIAAGGVWRCGGDPGAQCVMMDGIWRMQMWCVHSLVVGTLCLSAGKVSRMARVQAPYTWMNSAALEQRGAYGNVRHLCKDTTVGIRRTQVWFAQVCNTMCELYVPSQAMLIRVHYGRIHILANNYYFISRFAVLRFICFKVILPTPKQFN